MKPPESGVNVVVKVFSCFRGYNIRVHPEVNGTIYVASAQAGVYAIRATMGNSLANTACPKFRHDIRNTGRVGGSADYSLFNKSKLNPTVIWKFCTYDPPGSTPACTTDYEFYSSPALAIY